MGNSGRLWLGWGQGNTYPYPVGPSDAEGGECVTLRGPETVLCGLPSSLPGPTQIPVCGAHPLRFWLFCWGFAGSLPAPFPLPPPLLQTHTSVSFGCCGNSRALE